MGGGRGAEGLQGVGGWQGEAWPQKGQLTVQWGQGRLEGKWWGVRGEMIGTETGSLHLGWDSWWILEKREKKNEYEYRLQINCQSMFN